MAQGSATFTRVLACLGVLVSAGGAHAEGIETTVSGTVGLGRAATVLRVNDFMATWQNPANLAVVPSTDLGAELRLPLLSACFDRARDPALEDDYRTSNPELGYYGSEHFRQVCNKGSVMPAGNLGWAQAFESGWGYGIGFFTPAAVPNLEFGNDTIVSQQLDADAEMRPITTTGEESPNRFLLLKRQQLGGFLQVGAGVRLSPLVRIGASLGWGFATLHNRSVASAIGGTFRDQEVLNDLNVSDWFIPRALASVVVTPLPSLELAATLLYQGDVDGVGTVDFTGNGIRNAPRGNCRSDNPGPHCRIEDARLTAPFPRLSATLGVRYASLRAGRDRALDPMKDERWDVELNGSWSQTSHVDQYSVTLFEGDPPGRIALSTAERSVLQPLPASFKIPYQWKDTFGLRLGGDYNLLPELLALRAGLSYESNATPTSYMNIDAWAVNRFGLHLGGTVKLGNLKLSIAYAHIFFGSVEVPVGDGKVVEAVSANPMGAQAVNEGDFTASLNVLSGQVNYAF